ncbi:hypothetical protein ACFL2M_01055 [Patescibacteria group bacterium]
MSANTSWIGRNWLYIFLGGAALAGLVTAEFTKRQRAAEEERYELRLERSRLEQSTKAAKKEPASRCTRLKAERELRQSWPPIALNKPPRMGDPIELSLWPRMNLPTPIPLNLLQPSHPVSKELQDRFLRLLRLHPVAEIREDFFLRFARGEVVLHFMQNPGFSAAFLLRSRGGEWEPTLRVNPAFLARLSTRNDVLKAWLMLLHEHTHFTQWLNASPEVQKDFRSLDHTSPSTHWCKRNYWQEYEAYQVMCRAENDWGGMAAVISMCKALDSETAFHRAVFNNVLHSFSAETRPECHSIWAEEAGHPDPSAFEPLPDECASDEPAP